MNPRTMVLLDNAIIEGHFELASGLHSGKYLAKFQLLQYPDAVTEIARPLADSARQYQPETVIGPTMGGSAFAHEIARLMRIRWGYASNLPDRRKKGRYIPARYGQPAMTAGERVLIADDVITTGQTIEETIRAVTTAGGTPVAIAVMADRTDGQVEFGIPIIRGAMLDIPSFEPSECPQCADGVPLQGRDA